MSVYQSLGYNFNGANNVRLTTNAPVVQFTTLCEYSNTMTVNPDSCGVKELTRRGYRVEELKTIPLEDMIILHR